MSEYLPDELEGEVLYLLGNEGPKTFMQMDARFGFTVKNFRKLDRALQKLRRMGLIRFDRKRGWSRA